MIAKDVNATLSISYSSNRKVNIRLRDEVSRVEFFSGDMEYEDFTAALSSLQGQAFAEAEVRNLDAIGKTKMRKNVSIVCPLDSFDTKKLEEWLKLNAVHPGWEVDTCLASRNSVQRKDGQTTLNYHIFKFV